jgi:hypothetical protein
MISVSRRDAMSAYTSYMIDMFYKAADDAAPLERILAAVIDDRSMEADLL